jgi:site-specific DNA-methyltransferase (adenine-specific)
LRKKGFIIKNWIVWNKKDGFSPSKKKYVNNQEVILFFTKSEKYTFNSELIRVPYESSERMLHAEKKGILKNGKRWYPNKKGKLCSDVWLFSSDRHSRKQNGKTVKLGHPTPKPEKLIERIILASSNEGNTVLDLFSGSGTTSYVAKKLNRSFLAVENNIKYFKLIKERLEI